MGCSTFTKRSLSGPVQRGINMNNKQRAYLSGLAAKENSIIQIGKNSLTPEVVASIDEALEARELIKVTVLKNCFDDIRDIAETAAGRTRSKVVRVIGRRFVLYRPAKKPTIVLPR